MPDFNELNRNVWCVLGLPIDAVDMKSAIRIVQQSVVEHTPCFISTPNLNFLVASQKDAEFRNSVISSELSIADGMPLIWITKFLGIPLMERVPGSGMIEKLNETDNKKLNKIKVFFFGGIEGVAKSACDVLNTNNGQLICNGSYYPGFGAVQDMSQSDVIEKVNNSAADFVIVSLGAKKGQEWIMKNRHCINAPVISHLGAVVNFLSGDVKRSPVWMQKSGIEWLWRIYQEPALWNRYFFDGIALLKLIVTRVIPYKLFLLFNSRSDEKSSCSIDVSEKDGDIELILNGVFTYRNINTVRESFLNAIVTGKNLKIRMDDVSYIDSSVIGLIMILLKLVRENGCTLSLLNMPGRIRRIFAYNNALFLLDS